MPAVVVAIAPGRGCWQPHRQSIRPRPREAPDQPNGRAPVGRCMSTHAMRLKLVPHNQATPPACQCQPVCMQHAIRCTAPCTRGLPQANPVVTAVQVTSSHHAQPARSFSTAMLPQCVYTFASAKKQGDKQGCQKWDGFPVKAVLQSQCNTLGATKHHQAVLPPYPTLPHSSQRTLP